MNDDRLPLRGLGYVGIHAPDPVGWRDFATSICGLAPALTPPGPRENGVPIPAPDAVGIAADGSAFLKMDRRQWRLAVHPGQTPGLAYLGFELPTVADLESAMESISKRGVAIRAGTADELEARSVSGLAVFEDPAGHRLELFCSPIIDEPFVSAVDIEFQTGALGMGHAVLYVSEIETALDFYRDVLGFMRSDYMCFGPDGMGIHFLRCTPRHHTLALLQVGPPSGLQHLMFEATSLDGVGKTLDRVTTAGIPISSNLGRHRNDKMVSFYMRGPSGFDVEIGYDGLLVGDDWVEHEIAGFGDEWGHHGLDADALQPGD
ncbi:MAG: glyoxalase [Deltaproteobacteria bacterium]|jgi:3,4-dihydroxy-9,10-secoandrosta-1,3,5(10)-triene-9,17-dione 4,5-dioxygenase|nr:glyoxalase [Deltaproteobacteria bacterium]